MPKGVPAPEELVNDEVTFFSLDTDVIQSAGFNFEKGSLNQLPRQLPRSMALQLTEVVLKEIVGHRLEPVKAAAEKLQRAIADLQRLTALDLAPARAQVEQLNILSAAENKFETEVRQYAAQCRGAVLPLSHVNAEQLFAKYFTVTPPFGFKADKKSEFPDAAALLLLEQHAQNLQTKAIVVSRDAGWKGFAEQSEFLYYLGSIEELADLFAATDTHAQAVKAAITAAINDDASALRTELADALANHIAEADWDTAELYSGSHRFEAEINTAHVSSYTVHGDSLNVWKVDEEPGAWVAELTATVQAEVVVDIQWYVWDSIDREELAFGGQQCTFLKEVEVEAYLTCYNVALDAAPQTWQIEVEIGHGAYSLDPAEVEFDWSDDN